MNYWKKYRTTPLRNRRYSSLLRPIHMYPPGASEPTVVYKEPLFVDERSLLKNVLI